MPTENLRTPGTVITPERCTVHRDKAGAGQPAVLFPDSSYGEQSAIDVDVHPRAEACLVTFGGINAGVGIPPFEFDRLTSSLNCSRILVRDLSQAWYHRGLPGVAHDIPSLAESLGNVVRSVNARRVVFLGNSMGGYAAILFATLLDIPRVLAFSPQTFLSPWHKLWYADRRWWRPLSRMYLRRGIFQKTYDLCSVLRRSARPGLRCDIWYDSQYRLDRVHAERLRQFNGVQLHPLHSGGHSVVKELRETGELAAIMTAVLQEAG